MICWGILVPFKSPVVSAVLCNLLQSWCSTERSNLLLVINEVNQRRGLPRWSDEQQHLWPPKLHVFSSGIQQQQIFADLKKTSTILVRDLLFYWIISHRKRQKQFPCWKWALSKKCHHDQSVTETRGPSYKCSKSRLSIPIDRRLWKLTNRPVFWK